MKWIIGAAFLGILAALTAALIFLMRDRGGTNRTLNFLRIRVGLSVALLLFIWFSYWMGWLHPHAY
jgi:hypothetical protein